MAKRTPQRGADEWIAVARLTPMRWMAEKKMRLPVPWPTTPVSANQPRALQSAENRVPSMQAAVSPTRLTTEFRTMMLIRGLPVVIARRTVMSVIE